MGQVRAILERQTTVVASARTDYDLPRDSHTDDIDILMSSFAVTDAATYTELDAMIADIEIETVQGIESQMDATDYTTLLIHQMGYNQLIDGTVADNDRQVFYWRHPFGLSQPKLPEMSILGLHGDIARKLWLNHAADGAVDNRVITIIANGRNLEDKNPKYYGVFNGRKAATGAVGGENKVDINENTRNGVAAKVARIILFGTTQLPDAENASHILNTIRRIDVEVGKTKVTEIDPDIAQAINNPAVTTTSTLIDNGSFVVDMWRGRIAEIGIEDLPVVGQDDRLNILEGAANAYRVIFQSLLPTP